MKVTKKDLFLACLSALLGIVGALELRGWEDQLAPYVHIGIPIVTIFLILWFLRAWLYRALFFVCMKTFSGREDKIFESVMKIVSGREDKIFEAFMVSIATKEDDFFNLLKGQYPKSHFLSLLFDAEYKNESVYATTAFVYKKDSNPVRLLWLRRHKTHRDLLPPGGRLLANQLPHSYVKTLVSAETGIPSSELSFSPLFHREYKKHLGTPGGSSIRSHELPVVIQTEEVEQKRGVPFHYDFIYVLETTFQSVPKGSQSPVWLTKDDLIGESIKDPRFENVRLLAGEIYQRLEDGTERSLAW